MITQIAKPEAEVNQVTKGQGMRFDKTRSEKGPVSMETVDKRVRLDVDAGKAVKESLKSSLIGRSFTSLSILDKCK